MSDFQAAKYKAKIIRIYHECEGGIEKPVPKITYWHHEACRVMTNGDHKGWIFFPTLKRIMNSFSCLPRNSSFYIGKKTWKRLPKHPEYAEMRHYDVILTLQWRHWSTCSQRAAAEFLSFCRDGKQQKSWSGVRDKPQYIKIYPFINLYPSKKQNNSWEYIPVIKISSTHFPLYISKLLRHTHHNVLFLLMINMVATETLRCFAVLQILAVLQMKY